MNSNPENLDEYRVYLRVLADMQLDARFRGKEDVSDVVQDTLMLAHRDLEAFRGTTELERRAWLKKILTHTISNLRKKYRTGKRDVRMERSIDQNLQDSAMILGRQIQGDLTSPSLRLMNKELGERLAEALVQLLEDERTAVMLKHIHGWKVAEIAQHMSRTPESVAGLLRRGLSKLRHAMSDSSHD
ncbi:MAG: sigma-70 family RNA polymerase sigma factor [Planctomycetales bacterium]|nr:sigma-70 family RNA polymerase sigma factor [Planctomycetales bacterium]